MKRYLQPLLGAVLLVVGLATYVTLKVAGDLRAVRSVLTQDVGGIEPAEVKVAEARLESAQRTLRSAPARMLRVVPVLGQNLGAVSDIVDSSLPVLRAGTELTEALEPLRDGGLIEGKKLDLQKLRSVQAPALLQVATLENLESAARSARSGWLVPPVWDAVDELAARSDSLLAGATNLAGFLELSDRLVGADSPRTYLVLLLNNAELRGAGGILAGVGTLELDGGKVRIGKFRSVHALQTDPYEAVPAPSDYERRYSTYKANTTLWLNTSFSPDVPDVALVAARLYEKTTGVKTDGALVLDPRGIEALLPDDAEVKIPGGDQIPATEVARFIYSDAYSLYKNQVARRNAILALGKSAFKIALDAGFGGTEGLDKLGAAVAGGHMRMTSFDPSEQDLLANAGVAGELGADDETFPLRVVAQNFGSDNGQGTKLDFWIERAVTTGCELQLDGDEPEMTCTVETRVENEVPPGLGEYVGGAPYGVATSLLETYIPAAAEVASATLDGEPAETFLESEAGHQSVGMFVEMASGESRTTAVTFSAPVPEAGFTFSLTPQPLAKDANLELDLELPTGWRAVGSSGSADVPFSDDLDRPVTFRLEPDPHAGFGAFWQGIQRFWSRPPF